jgi:PhnB protein
MGKTVKAIPDGYHSITPGMSLRGCDQAIEFYKRAFGAEQRLCLRGPDGKVAHCEIKIGDSVVMFGEASEQHPPHPLHAMLYVQDCDAVFQRAVAAGATVKAPVADQFYGDRAGRIADPFGNEWWIATHKEDVSPDEMERRMKTMMAGGASA